VSSYLLIGLGEDPAQLIAGAEALIARGVYPFVVPVRPMPGTMAAEEGLLPPDATTVARIARAVGDRLAAAEMRGADQQAGCAACGGCSPLADGATPVRLGSRIAATSAVRG
jgi:hypothetical protein